jgi:hypothetical protein
VTEEEKQNYQIGGNVSLDALE